MPTDLKISQFTPSPGVGSSTKFAAVQTIGGIVTDVIVSVNQLLTFVYASLPVTYPTRVNFANATGLTATTNPVGVAYTSVNSASYQISSNLNITSGTGTVAVFVEFTDIHSNVIDQNLVSETGTGFATASTYLLTVKSGTNVTVKATLTGTATFDISFALIQVS